MRQIKFRGIPVGGKSFVYGGITSLLHTPDSKTYIVSTNSNEDQEQLEFIEVIPESVGQYVGKVGANACEVWEGDKVMATLNHQGKPTSIKFPAFISFNEHVGTWQIKYENYEGNYVSDDIGFRYFLEVIGSTHTQDGGQEE